MNCKHFPTDSRIDKKAILQRLLIPCDKCKGTRALWTCLESSCRFNGCGGKTDDHISKHFQTTGHPVAVNLKSFRFWCFACNDEINLLPTADVKLLKKNRKDLLLSKTRKHIDIKPETVQDSFTMDRDTVTSPYGLIGLRNLGNTCYMNAALQAISNCPPLTGYFLQGFADIDGARSVGPSMAENYNKLLREIWNQNSTKRPSCVTPNGVHLTLTNINPTFRGYLQQDAQEFLRCFMDRLHDELKQVVPRWTYEDIDLGSSGDAAVDDRNNGNKNEALHEAPLNQADEFTHIADSEMPLPREMPSVSAATPRPRQRQLSENDLHGSERSEPPSPRSPSLTQYPDLQKKNPYRFRSVISETFVGELRSSVQCLTCDQVSHTRETFQDLSLPIPGKDDLARLHTPPGTCSSGELAVNPGFNGPCMESSRFTGTWYNYAWSMWEWLAGWLWGPQVTLNDCLSAFFSADELKGDNMYHCNKCNKLRNGVKYCKLLELPEILCIHLKRFRHEYQMPYSSKVSNPVLFPIKSLDLNKYLAQDNPSSCTTYDLCSVVVHHGNAGGGHYTAYAKNMTNQKWYEFDDMYVTEVPESTVANAEAYVLFYQKYSVEAARFRDRILQRRNVDDILHFCVSSHWLRKFWSFTEPGEIDNSDFLCRHSGVRPELYSKTGQLPFAQAMPKSVWEQLHGKFGGGPAVTELSRCKICESELEALQCRRKEEDEMFRKLKKIPNADAHQFIVYISLVWFHEWEDFLTGTLPDPPGIIDNRPICYQKDGKFVLKRGSSYAPISRGAWEYFVSIYNGGPEVPHPMYVHPTRNPRRSAPSSPVECVQSPAPPGSIEVENDLEPTHELPGTNLTSSAEENLPLKDVVSPMECDE